MSSRPGRPSPSETGPVRGPGVLARLSKGPSSSVPTRTRKRIADGALKQIRPYLASVLCGKKDVRVVTVGYEMREWEASWAEHALGLTVFWYDMADKPEEPQEWEVRGEKEGDAKRNGRGGRESAKTLDFDFNYGDANESGELGRYLNKKRERDVEELDGGATADPPRRGVVGLRPIKVEASGRQERMGRAVRGLGDG